MQYEKALQLAKKLLALKKGGHGGEAENAGRMLAEICQRYHIEPEMLEDEEKYDFMYITPRKGSVKDKLFFQIMANVMGSGFGFGRDRKKPTRIYVKMSLSQRIEFDEKYRAWSKAFDRYLKDKESIALEAFVVANDIWGKVFSEAERKEIDDRERSEEEKERLRKVWLESQNITPTPVHKLIS